VSFKHYSPIKDPHSTSIAHYMILCSQGRVIFHSSLRVTFMLVLWYKTPLLFHLGICIAFILSFHWSLKLLWLDEHIVLHIIAMFLSLFKCSYNEAVSLAVDCFEVKLMKTMSTRSGSRFLENNLCLLTMNIVWGIFLYSLHSLLTFTPMLSCSYMNITIYYTAAIPSFVGLALALILRLGILLLLVKRNL
jgi:hypothetical protein